MDAGSESERERGRKREREREREREEERDREREGEREKEKEVDLIKHQRPGTHTEYLNKHTCTHIDEHKPWKSSYNTRIKKIREKMVKIFYADWIGYFNSMK